MPLNCGFFGLFSSSACKKSTPRVSDVNLSGLCLESVGNVDA